MPSKLWTPDREVVIGSHQSFEIPPADMAAIRDLHGPAQRHGIQLVCQRCGTPFQGGNSGHASTMAITCKCRELRAAMKSRLTI